MSCENKTFKITKRTILFFKRFLQYKFHEFKKLFKVLELSPDEFEESKQDPEYNDVHLKINSSRTEAEEYGMKFHLAKSWFHGDFFCEISCELIDDDDDGNSYWDVYVRIFVNINTRNIELQSFYEEASDRHNLIEHLDCLDREFVLCKYCDATPYFRESFLEGSCKDCYILATYGSEDCCICLSNEQIEPWIQINSCKHRIHMRCAKPLEKCPICRGKIESSDLERAFNKFEEDIV